MMETKLGDGQSIISTFMFHGYYGPDQDAMADSVKSGLPSDLEVMQEFSPFSSLNA